MFCGKPFYIYIPLKQAIEKVLVLTNLRYYNLNTIPA